jgi:alkylated DNA repair dioxygenase AlkB
MSKKIRSLANLPTLGPGDVVGQGESFIKYELIDPDKKSPLDPNKSVGDHIFELLNDEVDWQKMYHASGEVPRLVAVQGKIGKDGSKPVYRHPSDQSPPLLEFTPTVALIKTAAEETVGHELNHVLIQLYRDGNDYISEHSDKTLDIVRGSKIVNASFGARRTMRLRRKKKAVNSDTVEQPNLGEPRETQRIPMPHNSLFILGLETNRSWLHGINADKRLAAERSPEEQAYGGKRISLTFRSIGTFLDAEEKHIWGQGAKGKTRDSANKVVAGEDEQTEKVIIAFGKENHQDEEFDWEGSYGEGFDVLHFRA